VNASLRPLAETGAHQSAAAFVEPLRLREGAGSRPRIIADMIASVDGRAAVDGKSVGLGHPADRALLRELRTAADAVLVGTGTLRAEGYANLLDPDQRARRCARGLPPTPLVCTVSRNLEVPRGVPLFAEADARVAIYTEAAGSVRGAGADVHVHRFAPGQLGLSGVIDHLATEYGVRAVLCEGGPTLLRRLVADALLDDLFLTVSPMLVAGDAPAPLSGPVLHPVRRLSLRHVARADDHVLLHYAVAR
jgi:riboflavin biosynthesis pyrimidine reductase